MTHARLLISLPVLAICLLAAGCGDTTATTQPACLQGPAGFAKALQGTPSNARLDGAVPISDCLVRNQPDGDLLNVGDSLVKVATGLSIEMKDKSPTHPSAAMQAGFLVGAVEKGAEDTDGIHATLLQRVKSAATHNLTTYMQAEYEQGYEAAKNDG